VLRRPNYALSIKQPWAALLVSGRKTIEIRKWPTAIRGRVFIHAGRIPDRHPEAWALISDELRPLTEFRGGVIGTADLNGCVIYRTQAKFADDVAKHCNQPSWFTPPHLYGFVFGGAAVLPFFPCKGNVRFFTVAVPEVK
jgi:ASCH domain